MTPRSTPRPPLRESSTDRVLLRWCDPGFVGFVGEALRIGFGTIALDAIASFAALSNTRSRALMARIDLHDADADADAPGVAEGRPMRRHGPDRPGRAQGLRAGAHAGLH